eukprot:scaffold8181_cov116-Isochrysis_galbana.AAC.3
MTYHRLGLAQLSHRHCQTPPCCHPCPRPRHYLCPRSTPPRLSPAGLTFGTIESHPPKTHRVGPGSGINPSTTQAQTPRGVTVGTLTRGPPLRVRGDRG